MNHPLRIRVLPALVSFAAVGVALMVMGPDAGADVPLPRPVDVPPGPEGVPGPGGAMLPPLAEEAPAGAPAISAISDVTFPDETLAIAGFGLSGAHLRIWREGGTEDLAPLRTAHDRMLAVVPRDWPVSAMLVWPVRDGQAGAPIRVNGATAWWAWPPRIAANAEGRLSTSPGPPTLLLMGKNLKLDGAEPQVYLCGPGGPRQLTVVAARAYQLTVQLPDALRHGVYEVFAHNGTGGPFGWSRPVRVEVAPAPA
ncbi:MAG: hypothetical protein RBS80_32215, partial [Thermoguttaceae bacterium]|nr:hypothetical protein [Thermoguttaceae bacterium]